MKRVNTHVDHMMTGMVGLVLSLTSSHAVQRHRSERDERGGSVGIQELLLIALAIVVLGVIAFAVKAYVNKHLP